MGKFVSTLTVWSLETAKKISDDTDFECNEQEELREWIVRCILKISQKWHSEIAMK